MTSILLHLMLTVAAAEAGPLPPERPMAMTRDLLFRKVMRRREGPVMQPYRLWRHWVWSGEPEADHLEVVLDEARLEVEALTGRPMTEPATFWIADEGLHYQHMLEHLNEEPGAYTGRGASWPLGQYKPSKRTVVMMPPISRYQFERTLAHEFSHHGFATFIGLENHWAINREQRTFTEGVALLVEANTVSATRRRAIVGGWAAHLLRRMDEHGDGGSLYDAVEAEVNGGKSYAAGAMYLAAAGEEHDGLTRRLRAMRDAGPEEAVTLARQATRLVGGDRLRAWAERQVEAAGEGLLPAGTFELPPMP